MKMAKVIMASALAFGIAGGASATTVTYNLWNVGSSDTKTSSLTYNAGGVTLTVTANTTGHSTDKVAYRKNAGLGVFCTDKCIADSPEMGSDLIKGSGREVLTFTFSQAINLSSFDFYLFDGPDGAKLTYGATNTNIGTGNVASDNGGHPVIGFTKYTVAGSPLVTSFKIAATGATTSFRVSDISVNTVSAVPVPAAAWLMGSGLLGLAGVARRRRS